MEGSMKRRRTLNCVHLALSIAEQDRLHRREKRKFKIKNQFRSLASAPCTPEATAGKKGKEKQDLIYRKAHLHIPNSRDTQRLTCHRILKAAAAAGTHTIHASNHNHRITVRCLSFIWQLNSQTLLLDSALALSIILFIFPFSSHRLFLSSPSKAFTASTSTPPTPSSAFTTTATKVDPW